MNMTYAVTYNGFPPPLPGFDLRTKGHFTLTSILLEVSRFYGLSTRELRSARRSRYVARPRQIAMFLARELTPKSLPEIGRFYDRDHTTVIHACRQVEYLIANDAEIAEDVASLRWNLAKIIPALAA